MPPQTPPTNGPPTPPASELDSPPSELIANSQHGRVEEPLPSANIPEQTEAPFNHTDLTVGDEVEVLGATEPGTERLPKTASGDVDAGDAVNLGPENSQDDSVTQVSPEANGSNNNHDGADGSGDASDNSANIGKQPGPQDGETPEKAETPEDLGLSLPQWFLDKNVVLAGEPQSLPGRLGLYTSATAAEDASALADYEIHQSSYDEIRDVIFSGVQQVDVHDSPPPYWIDSVAFLVQSPKKGSLEFLDAIVYRLAKDFGSDLISVDLEDLEDLCHHFWPDAAAESKPQAKLDEPHRFIKDYYTKYTSWPDETRSATNAVVKGSEVKRAGVKSEDQPDRLGCEASRPVIVLLRDVEGYNTPTLFSQCYEAVKKRRKEGQSFVIVATAVSTSSELYKNRSYAMDKVWDGLHLEPSAVVNVSPRRTQRSEQALRQNTEDIIPRTRWRHFRRALRATLGAEAMSSVLAPPVEWLLPDTEDMKRTTKNWDNAMGAKVLRQVWTRARQTSNLTLDDITEIMVRVSHNREVFELSSDDSRGFDNDEDGSTPKVRRILDSISSSCSEDEKGFFDCVIDTDTLTATGESIRVDSDILESLEQLLSLRVHKSYGLLAGESVNGAILYGPPGTGKTHLARVVAKAAGMNLIVATPADIQSCYVGQTEQRIKGLFSLSVKLAPCIIFLDEADSVLARRNPDDKDWTRKAMSQFLIEMDGLRKADRPPFLLIATNRPCDIDDAVCRRLPHMLQIGMPSAGDRAAIFGIYLREEEVSNDVDITILSEKLTAGFSGSDIRTLCVQAAMAAQRELDLSMKDRTDKDAEPRRRLISMSHFNKALNRTRPSVTRESLLEIQKFAAQRRKTR